MPLYEYECRSCGHRFELLQRIGEGGSSLVCPRCDAAEPQKLLSAFATTGGGDKRAGASTAACSGPT